MPNARELTENLASLLRREQDALAEFLVALADFDHRRAWVELGHSSRSRSGTRRWMDSPWVYVARGCAWGREEPGRAPPDAFDGVNVEPRSGRCLGLPSGPPPPYRPAPAPAGADAPAASAWPRSPSRTTSAIAATKSGRVPSAGTLR